jgi:hypothetical protein
MTQAEISVFSSWIQRQRLVQDESDQGKENAGNVISWVRERGLDITPRSLDMALTNIVNSGHIGHANLHVARERAAEAHRMAAIMDIKTSANETGFGVAVATSVETRH